MADQAARVSRNLARLAIRALEAYLDIYHGPEDSGPDSGMPPYDTRSTAAGQFEIAPDSTARTAVRSFGFGPPRRGLRLRDIDVGGHDD